MAVPNARMPSSVDGLAGRDGMGVVRPCGTNIRCGRPRGVSAQDSQRAFCSDVGFCWGGCVAGMAGGVDGTCERWRR